jgi:glycosyltransferase involved in cell wall biosynthesis
MASGLPVLCTETVGAVPDLIRPERTGLIAPTNDTAAIARAMKWFHDHYDRLPTMGQFAKETAAPYAAQNWAHRFIQMADAIRRLPVRRR